MFKTRELLFDKKNVYEVIEVLQKNGHLSVRVGNCGWKNAPDAMFAIFTCSKKKYCKILMELKTKYGIDTLPETVGY